MDPLVASLMRLADDQCAVEDAGGAWTARELRRAVRSARACFARIGIGAGDRVAIVAAEDRRIVAALLGARAAGALVCPLDAATATEDAVRLAPRAVVAAGKAPGLESIEVETVLAETDAPLPDDPGSDPASPAWGVATSGSSGNRKTVVLTEGSVAHVTAAVQDLVRYTAADRVHGALPLSHTYGLSQLWLAIASGACLYLPGCAPTRANLGRWLGGATILPTIASKLKFLFDTGACPQVRLITLAGQGADPDSREQFASAPCPARYIYFYGLTEATTRVLWLGHDEFFQRPRATGRPIAGVRAWVEADGELWVDGPNVAAGYLDDTAATAARFPGGKLRTGDYFDLDGDLFVFRGRLDGVFKRFGEKVVPEQIEAALDSHPGVVRSLVTPEPGPGGELVPVAWVVGRDGPVDGQALLRHARARLPAVMVPTAVRPVASLPTTSNGKLLRTTPPVELALARPAPAKVSPSGAEVERWLHASVAELVAVAPESIDALRPLAEYGVDSVGTVDLVARISEWLGVRVSYSIVWSYPTISALAEHLTSVAAPGGTGSDALRAEPWTPPVRRGGRDGAAPISELERWRLRLSMADPEADGRSVWFGAETDGDFQPEIFAAAVNALVKRHDVLRSKYDIDGDGGSKLILPALPIEVLRYEVAGQPDAARRASALARLRDAAATPFDLTTAPLIRAVVVELAERRHLFLVVCDHVVADAASAALAWSDLRLLYETIASGRELPPPPRPQYADFTDWQAQLLAGEQGARLVNHWRFHLRGAPRVVDGTRASSACRSIFLDVPRSLAERVRQTAMMHGCTQYVFHYAAVAALLAATTGQPDVAISTAFDFRNREPGLRQVIGMMTNACGLRLSLHGVKTAAELLHRAKHEVARMISASDLPATLCPEGRDAFRVLFNYMELPARAGSLAPWKGFTVRPLGRAALSMGSSSHASSSYDLLFVLRKEGDRLSGAILANESLWSPDQLKQLAAGYSSLLEQMTQGSQLAL